ncbi:bifunctional diguanylate cyclase/phosphodiesterase [Flocculibacter collagenilyticus]|uniref:bifunctional diguanylate cyclase/phosphodiesterase n=1 Tax=Flocculibacter collagenilyticus TaxID=2744479 RepID=UPI0018F38015|nr:EAL domain-containing protein [Flocculibacter collagenilyticus]
MQSNVHHIDEQIDFVNFINYVATSLFELNKTDEICNFIAKAVVTHLGYEDCVIYLLNDEQQVLTQFASYGHSTVDGVYVSHLTEIQVGEGIVGTCAKLGKPQLVSDTRKDERYRVDNLPALSELSVPILFEDKILGVIDCESACAEFFDKTHLNIITTISAVLSSKLHKTFALADLKKSVVRLEKAEAVQKALFEIASLTYTATDIGDVYKKVHHILGRLMHSDNFYIALFDQSLNKLNFPYYQDENSDISPDEYFSESVLKFSLTGKVFRDKAPLLATKAQLQALIDSGECKLFGGLAESYLAVPFKSGDSVEGVVCIQSYNADIHYNESDKELLTFVSHHISNVLKKLMAEKDLQKLALHDSLTGLPNRLLLLDRIGHALDNVKRTHDAIAVLYLDLDHFKMVNDTLGHMIGDAFLIEASNLLQECIRENDTLARLGGDEFVILLEGIKLKDEAEEVSARIIQAFNNPVDVGDHKINTSISIGIAYPSDETFDSHEILKKADIALYAAKAAGRNNYRVYQDGVGESYLTRFEAQMRRAMEREHLRMSYQPIINLKNNKVAGFESLVRWYDPDKGVIPPDDFVPYAEENHLIGLIDMFVLEQVCRQIKKLKRSFKFNGYVSVNISGETFSSDSFDQVVLSKLEEMNIKPKHLAIELTERGLINNIKAAKSNMKNLRSAGVKIFIDDFGTGYSSLSYLHQFSVDALKIDKSFIQTLQDKSSENAIVTTILALAKSLKIKVIAEGIELKKQQRLLIDLNCHFAQGYLFSRPLEQDKLSDILEKNETSA